MWPWSYGSWIYSYLCNQCLSPLMLWVRISIRVMCRTFCNIVRQWFATGRLFSQGTAVYSTDKNWWPRYNWNIVESGVKHHKPSLRLSWRSCICVLVVLILPLYHISIICWNCYNSVVFFVYLYHMLELFQHCGIFCLFLSYVGTVPTVWYLLFFTWSICCYKTP